MGSASGVWNIILVTAVKYPAFTGVIEGQGKNVLKEILPPCGMCRCFCSFVFLAH